MKPFIYGGGNIPMENVGLLNDLFVLIGDVIKAY